MIHNEYCNKISQFSSKDSDLLLHTAVIAKLNYKARLKTMKIDQKAMYDSINLYLLRERKIEALTGSRTLTDLFRF